jgi:hypothetical protein
LKKACENTFNVVSLSNNNNNNNKIKKKREMMSTTTTTTTTKQQLPTFLTKNYFTVASHQKALKRREVEEAIHEEALQFFQSLGFETFVNNFTNEITCQMKYKSDSITVNFNYEESAKRIYRKFKVFKNGNKSNRKVIEKIMNNK